MYDLGAKDMSDERTAITRFALHQKRPCVGQKKRVYVDKYLAPAKRQTHTIIMRTMNTARGTENISSFCQ